VSTAQRRQVDLEAQLESTRLDAKEQIAGVSALSINLRRTAHPQDPVTLQYGWSNPSDIPAGGK
jgi:hypothetical protein